MTHLFGEQTRRTIEDMSFSGRTLDEFPEFISAAVAVKEAAARTNVACGLLDAAVGDRIIEACRVVRSGEHRDQFPVDVFHGGGGIGFNQNINEVLGSLSGADPGDEVNLSQSTNDASLSAVRLAVHRSLTDLRAPIQRLIDELGRLADRYAGVETIARTCLQDGLPVEAAKLFTALASALTRQLAHLDERAEELLAVNLGGTVIGSGAGADPAYRARIIETLAEVTGLPVRAPEDLYDATQNPDDLARASHEVMVIAHLVARFAQDLRLLSSGPECGLGEIRLPATQAGSSFFPGKVNPVIPETVIQCDLLVTGNDSVVQRCLVMGETYLNLWDFTMGFLVMDSAHKLGRVLDLFVEHCVSGIEIDVETCQRYTTATMPSLVRLKEQLGYGVVSKGIKEEGATAFVQRHQQQREAE